MSTHNAHYPTEKKLKGLCSSLSVPIDLLNHPSIKCRKTYDFEDSVCSVIRVSLYELDGSFFFAFPYCGKVLTSVSFVSLRNCFSALRSEAKFLGWFDCNKL